MDKETVFKFLAVFAIPLVAFGLMRAFYKDPSLFGISIKPNSANAVPSRKALEDRTKKCRIPVDITALGDKELNDLVWTCEQKNNGAVKQ